MSEQVQVLIVDDSAFMRKSLSLLLESDPGIKVIGTARDGIEGIEKIKKLKPDIVTMDIEMPRMDGITALQVLMKECPVPVLMVSSLTNEGAEATIQAMEFGAVDFIPKQLAYASLNISKIKEDLITKVHAIARSSAIRTRFLYLKTNALLADKHPIPSVVQPTRWKETIPDIDFKIVTIGISTGGPFALHSIIPKIPKSFPKGIVIVQHMPPKFTKSLADRLNSLSEVKVKEAEEGDGVRSGEVLIAPGGLHLTFHKNGDGVEVHLSEQPSTSLHRPSVDVMMNSAAEVIGEGILAVIMTGMGKDGLEGLKNIKRKNGYIIAQNEETCVVYGMPRVAVEAGVSNIVVPLEQIPDILTRIVTHNS